MQHTTDSGKMPGVRANARADQAARGPVRTAESGSGMAAAIGCAILMALSHELTVIPRLLETCSPLEPWLRGCERQFARDLIRRDPGAQRSVKCWRLLGLTRQFRSLIDHSHSPAGLPISGPSHWTVLDQRARATPACESRVSTRVRDSRPRNTAGSLVVPLLSTLGLSSSGLASRWVCRTTAHSPEICSPQSRTSPRQPPTTRQIISFAS